jgi:hypothetical protein
MKNLFSLLLLVVVCFTFSCKKDCGDGIIPVVENPKSIVKLTFKANFDGQPLKRKTDFMYGIYPVQFSRFTLFVTNISLLKGTVETKLTEAEFLEFFSESATDNNSTTPTFTYKDIPSDKYTGIKIGYGVSSDLNAKKPADFAANHALANENEYWAGWKSYIFSKIEGTAELVEDTTFINYESFLNYHSGSAVAQNVDVATSFNFEQTIDISGAEKQIYVNLDLKKLFTIGTKLLDITQTDNQYTGTNPSDLGLAKKLMDNWFKATTIQ